MEFSGLKTTVVGLWSVLLGILAITAGVRGQQTDEGNFISIDCGIPDGSSYTDDGTKITYTSDAQFIDAGVNHNISADRMTTSLPRQQSSLRSFPNGPRNCYTLKPVKQGQKYLIRAFFLHGKYDGNADVSIQFDLHLGVNLWKTMNISNTSLVDSTETMAIASADFVSVCLINKGHGTPFISSLELRPLKNTLYPAVNSTSSLVLSARRNFGKKDGTILRYPDDPKDRIWIPFRNDPFWSDISTTNEVDHEKDDPFEVPRTVLQAAAVPVNSNNLSFYWWAGSSDETRLTYHYFMHFAEIQDEHRTFNININGDFWYGPVTPLYRMSLTVYTTSAGNLYWYNISLLATASSTFPPSINAIEIYSVMLISANETNVQDVKAVMAIKEHYNVKRNWMGDPCAPIEYAWDGLDCNSNTNSDKPRIISLNLSSSGLTGDLIQEFAELKVIENLDLSYNNLTGSIPDFLAELSSLKVLNLTGNKFSGSIPSALLERNSTGSLILRVEVIGSTTCDIDNSCKMEKKKKKIAIPILAIVIVVLLGLLLVVVFIVCRMRRRQQGLVLGTAVRPQNENYFLQQVDHEDYPLQLENRRFAYMELQKITNNFNHIIGKGGFGSVFHGYLENGTQVAVKTRSQSSTQGTKEFLAEAKLLTRVHHKNLVSLVGYCKDGNYLALVYEYMSQGSLHDHLRGKPAYIKVLSWRERLQIALESAQGLEYLHTGCRPTIVHRDVKTSNILLNHNLEAKIADFGLSKAFQSDVHSHISTAVVGTPGYLDPEYYQTYQLNEKSDVYSFGVVLLELITGQPPLLPARGEGHIVQRVGPKVAQGNIDDVVDARLQGAYDVNSVWKTLDIALMCTAQSSVQRATMGDVVMQLKESLALQIAWNQHHYTETVDISLNSVFEIADVGKLSVVEGPSAR
ncbi:probable LRR receptor-like serine/threonine-protein kinase At1g05700 [Elaeis guineensis]|uniref:non-specific serine/threonine protein kinase n=1 Tax=Elaeis guineensis var. tenera TaxID=51953 RepID=A0A6I9QTD8_ELAGV|nr:probable LRR receptor-like serine/threonine-protein kinase At1g05700 [Elaeis guineensis]